MHNLRRWLLVRSPVLLMLPLLASCGGEPPTGLGTEGGRLTPCPETPNCVSTREDEDEGHRMDPIPFAGSAEEAMTTIAETVEEMPRAEVVGREGDYLRAEFTSRIFRFVDDVEFWVDGEEGLIHFRSASRVGRSDMGVNLERMTEITTKLEAKLVRDPKQPGTVSPLLRNSGIPLESNRTCDTNYQGSVLQVLNIQIR